MQDAKNRFSSVVRAARAGRPQTVTKHGRAAVVVLAAEDYARLRDAERAAAPGFVDHLLAMPAVAGPAFGRLPGALRDLGR
ncbi:MAG: type II toxin-antitoxin system Phd/YefM family antitoxin [Alphaproteobacteria bacterium]|nr:type II toxin-antitoxin system Phd/YefM family antitoxin [Alphaproteobacteria bacterium]